MLALDHWYIACPSSQLVDGVPKAVQIGDLNLVLFRGQSNKPVALLDRCCHRGVKLSRGRVQKNGCIACGYHGWEYDEKGQVIKIPSLGDDSNLPNYKVPSFSVVESQFYIWVWIAGESENPTYQPYIRGLDTGRWIQQTNIWHCNVMPAVENQLDITHTAFSHPGNYPTHDSEIEGIPDLVQMRWRSVASEHDVSIFATRDTQQDDPAPTVENPAQGLGFFEMPYRNHVLLPSAQTSAVYHWIPLSESTVRLEFLGYVGSPTDQSLSVIYLPEELEILSQDRILLESAQDTFDQAIDKHVRGDHAPLAARAIMQSAVGLVEKPKPVTTEFEAFAR